jgi:hypothetical protein
LKKAAKQSRPSPRVANRRRAKGGKPGPVSLAWIRELAAPYLKGYQPVAATGRDLQGYWFLASAKPPRAIRGSRRTNPPARGQAAGFFVGYLYAQGRWQFLSPQLPECLAFAWVHPIGGTLYRRLVKEHGSLLRNTFEYIRWLTHRPPRFVFHDEVLPVLARHQSMGEWAATKRQHLSRNFFIETLAWLVRSGLVRKLRDEVH